MTRKLMKSAHSQAAESLITIFPSCKLELDSLKAEPNSNLVDARIKTAIGSWTFFLHIPRTDGGNLKIH